MLTPEPGQDVEIVTRGKVRRVACHGRAALVERPDGQVRWFEIPDDLTDSVVWRLS